MKDKRVKKENSLKKKINELKKTTRGKAIWRLIKWCIFFTLLFIFLAVVSLISPQTKKIQKPNNNEVKEQVNEPVEKETLNEETLTIETIRNFQNYLSNIYDYNYEVTINNEKYIYSGTKTKNDNKGYKESKSGIIKYYIDNTGTYMETTSEKILIDNLYEGIEENYLNPIYILNVIKALVITRDKENESTEQVYKTNDSKNIYRINIVNKEIKSISITALDFSYLYTLDFKNVKS